MNTYDVKFEDTIGMFDAFDFETFHGIPWEDVFIFIYRPIRVRKSKVAYRTSF